MSATHDDVGRHQLIEDDLHFVGTHVATDWSSG